MVTKYYGIPGKTNAEIRIQVGKASLSLVFSNGCLDRKNYKPAMYATSDATLQNMIEASPLFGKSIHLIRVVDTESDKTVNKKAVKKETAPAPKVLSFPEVDTFEKVIEVLKANGAKDSNLAPIDKLKKYIAVKGFEFPNYTFE